MFIVLGHDSVSTSERNAFFVTEQCCKTFLVAKYLDN